MGKPRNDQEKLGYVWLDLVPPANQRQCTPAKATIEAKNSLTGIGAHWASVRGWPHCPLYTGPLFSLKEARPSSRSLVGMVSQVGIGLDGKSRLQAAVDGLFGLLDQFLPQLGPQQRTHILDAAAVSAYHGLMEFPVVRVLVADDAPQFKIITEQLSLCWIPDGRHYKKQGGRTHLPLLHCGAGGMSLVDARNSSKLTSNNGLRQGFFRNPPISNQHALHPGTGSPTPMPRYIELMLGPVPSIPYAPRATLRAGRVDLLTKSIRSHTKSFPHSFRP